MLPVYSSMDDFVDELKALARQGFTKSQVHEYLQRTLIKPEHLETYITFRPDRYTRNLVYKSAVFELLVICWGVDQRAPIHGHEGELCWARVEQGVLRFTNYRLASETPLALDRMGDPVNGERGYVDGPADIHQVENLGSSREPAVSLHIYSFPYPECDIYDLESGTQHRVPLTYDTMFGKPDCS